MKKNFSFSKLILGLIFLFALALMIFSAKTDSITTDEGIHLLAGYTYIMKGDFRLDSEHPPLLKEIAAVSSLFIHNIKVPLDGLWDKAGEFYYDSWQETRALAENFLFAIGNDANKLVFWGRLPFIILTLILGFVTFRWSRKLYGQNAGIFAAFLILLMPNILAHGRLINTDLGLTLFLFLAIFFWMKFLKMPNWLSFLLSGIFAGLAWASKFTSLILILILVILAIAKLIDDRGFKNWLKYLGGFVGVLMIGTVIVWLTYGFSILAPAIFFKGLVLISRHIVAGHSSFLLGQTSDTGWWYYFPVAIWYKTPIPFFIFLALAIIFVKKIRAQESFDEIALILTPLIFLIISMFSKADLGVRHVLPIFPFLAVCVSKSINLVDFREIKFFKTNVKKLIPALLFILLILWYLLSSVSSYPNYLAYFNEFASGPKDGYKILADSNLDWGQDIFRIKKYLDEHNITDGYILYPWDGDSALRYYGIDLKPFPWDNQGIKGYVVISVTYYQLAEMRWLDSYSREQITPGVFIFDLK